MPNPEKEDIVEPEVKPRFNPFGGKDTREPTWSDYGRAVAVGTRNIQSGAGAAARAIGERYDLPRVSRAGREAQTVAREANEQTLSEMTPSARARLESSLGDEEFMGDIISSLGLKLTATSPTVVAAAVPATVFSGAVATTLAAAAVGSALNTSSFVDELYQLTDQMPDYQLQEQSPVYAKLRAGMDEEAAREEFNSIVRGLSPVYVAAATALTSGLGPAAQLARGIRGAGASLTHGGIRGAALEGALAETVEEGLPAYASEYARIATGEQTEINRSRIASRTLEGTVLGGIMGAGAGAIPGGERNRAKPAKPSTAPAITSVPGSTTAGAKTAATPASPSATQQAAPSAPVTPTPAEAAAPRPKPKKVEIVNAVGVDQNVAAALAPETPAAPVAPVAPANQNAPAPDVAAAPAAAPTAVAGPTAPRKRPVIVPISKQPAAAAPASPVQENVAAPVTPEGNVPVPAELPPPETELAPPAAASVRGQPVAGATTRAPRILPDVRPEAVEMARDDAFQQNEAVRSNIAAIRAEERGPAGRTDLYGKAGQKRRADAEAAKGIFEKRVTDDIVLPDAKNVDARTALKRRVDGIMQEAKDAGISIPTRIDYDGTAPTADHLVWLREVADMQKAFNAKTPPSVERMTTFLLRERAAKNGDFDIMKSERRAEGDQKARASQGDVEKLAGNAAQIAAAKEEAGEGTVAAPVASAANAEADAVPTVASKTKRGAVRDEKSEAKPASAVRKIELTPEEKAAYAEKLLGQQKAKAELSGRVVDDAKFTKEVAKKAAAPVVEKAAAEETAPRPRMRWDPIKIDGNTHPVAGALNRLREFANGLSDADYRRLEAETKGSSEYAFPRMVGNAAGEDTVDKLIKDWKDRLAPVPSKVTPKVAAVKEKIAKAAARVEKTPSQAKIDANNFTKGHVSIQGLPVTIETARGEMREGTGRGGKKWSVKMPAHYGEIKRTEGADGDPLDVYIGPAPDSDYVLVIDQNDPDTGRFDELKSFVGYRHMNAALEDYVRSFSDGKGAQRFGEFRNMTMAEFKEFTKTAQTKRPLADQQIKTEAEMDAAFGSNEPLLPSAGEPNIAPEYARSPSYMGYTELDAYSATDAFKFITSDWLTGPSRAMFQTMASKIKEALAGHDVVVYVLSDADYLDRVGQHNANTAGVYDENMQSIYMPARVWNGDPGRRSRVLMHELVHAATTTKLFNEVQMLNRMGRRGILQASPAAQKAYFAAEEKTAYGQILELMTWVQNQIGTQIANPEQNLRGFLPEHQRQYGFTNPFEFIAEAMTEPTFQDTLASFEIPPFLKNLLQMDAATKVSAWQGFLNIIRRALGMAPQQYTALEAAVSLTERLTYATRQPDMEVLFNRSMRTGEQITPEARSRIRTQLGLVDDPGGFLANRIDEAVRPLLTDARRSLGDPKWLRMRSMTDMAALAKSYFKGNSVRRVVNAIEAIRVSGNQIAQEADPVIQDLINAQKRYKGTPAFENLLTVMHDATMSGAHPDRTLEANTQLGKKSMRGAWGRAQHAELQQRYNALPADLKAVYQKSLTYFTEAQNKLIRQGLENRVLKALGFEDSALADRIFNDATTEADKALLGDLYEVVAEPSEFKKLRGPYFPLKRFGNYVVRGTYDIQMPTTASRQIDENTFEFDTRAAAEDFVGRQKNHSTMQSVYVDEATGSLYFIDDDGKQVRVHQNDADAVQRFRVRVQNRHLEFFENRREAEARREELAAEGVRMEAVVERRDDPRQATGDLLSTHMERLMRRVEARDSYKAMSPLQQQEVQKAIEEASYAALASTRIQTSRIQRRYVEGASKDIIRSTAEYAGSLSGYLARYQHMGELDAALKEMNKEADTSGDPRTAMGRSTIRNEIMYRLNQPNIAPSQHNSKIDQWRHRLLVTSFIGHLASPAYSLVNATQPVMVTTPVLAARHGLGSAVAAMTKAYSDISALKTTGAGIMNTARRARDQHARTNTYVGDILDRLSNPRERAMIGHLIKHGAIDGDAGLEVGKLVDQTRGDQWLSYFEGISRQLPLAVESINRFASALSAYRLEMKRNGGDHEAATQYAQEIVESTQGIYAGTNTPPVFSSPIASIAFQFKKYGHLIYSLLGQQIGKAIRNESAGDRAEAIKALGFIVGAHMTMAGTVGLPTEGIKLMLMGANMLGLTGLTMEDFEEWEREQLQSVFGDTAAEMMTHGILRGLPGGFSMDLSGRMGMQSYLTFGAPDSAEESDIWSFLGETVAGAPGGMLVDMAQGGRNIAMGNVTKGMEQLVPVKVIKDGLKAYQQATEGKSTKSGRQSLTPLSMPEAALRLFGITPGRAAETQLMQSSYYRNTGRLREERLQFQYDWASASPRQRQKLWSRIQEWNKGQSPEMRLSYSQLGQYLKRRREEDRGQTIGGMRVTNRDKAVAERVDRIYNQ